MPKCPISQMAAASLKSLSETYKNLINAAGELEKSELAAEAQKRRAWRRAERAGRVLDDLIANWEQESCAAVFYSCVWEQAERELRVIDSLTPCSQWQLPPHGKD